MFWHSSKSRVFVGDEVENEKIRSEILSNDLTRHSLLNISDRKSTKEVLIRYDKQYLERKKIKLIFEVRF